MYEYTENLQLGFNSVLIVNVFMIKCLNYLEL